MVWPHRCLWIRPPCSNFTCSFILYLTPQIISYSQDICSKLQGRVVTSDWETEPFEFPKGIFQGAPYSGTIFLIVFNPLIEHIKKPKNTQATTSITQGSSLHPLLTTSISTAITKSNIRSSLTTPWVKLQAWGSPSSPVNVCPCQKCQENPKTSPFY